MRIFIAEDEPLAAQKLRLFLDRLGEGGDVRLFDNGITLLSALQQSAETPTQAPDLLFLDIQMPGLTGMQVLERMQHDWSCQVIITSAYEEYALPSFAFNVTDYLLKPYSLDRLKQALQKAHEILRLRQLDKQIHASTLTFRIDGQNLILPTHEILCFEALKDYVRITTADGLQRLTLSSLSSIEEQLPKESFARVHRSFVVNLDHITGFSHQVLSLPHGIEIPIGKTYQKLFIPKTKA